MRKLILAANWKMYKTCAEAEAFAAELVGYLDREGLSDKVEILVCPPAIALPTLAKAVEGTPVLVGGQNCYTKKEGAFTGETSPATLKAEGASYVIIGHSERRQIIGEQDAFLNEKIKAALEFGLRPILCVGETLDQRNNGETSDFCRGQLAAALEGLGPEICDTLVIAYEPIWAIGTGVNASTDDAQGTISVLRQWLVQTYGASAADKVQIQYGGSVRPENVKSYLSMPDIDGALIGGASLVAESFWQMLKQAEAV